MPIAKWQHLRRREPRGYYPTEKPMVRTEMLNLKQIGQVFLASILIAAGSVSVAQAHPHVWVKTRATLNYENASLIGVTQSWMFDELYTAMAIQGLDKDGDGVYSRQELAELATINMEGIQEYGYFTDVRLGDKRLGVKERDDYWLEHSKDGVLTLHFTIDFENPVLAEAEGFSFSVYDPSFFIAYEFVKTDAIALGPGAPKACQANLANKDEGGDQAALNEALTAQLGDYAGGISMMQQVEVSCPRS